MMNKDTAINEEGDGSIRVLLVEDNPGDALLLEELLAEAGGNRFSVENASTLSSALERVRIGEIDLILLDLSLPDSKGKPTFTSVRNCARDLPIIVLSGIDDEALAVSTVQEGAQDYLVKGRVDGRLLVRSMRYALERRQAEKSLAEERNLLRNLIDNLLDYVYVKDKEGRYLIDNLAHIRILGAKTSEEIVSRKVFDFFPREAASKYHDDDLRVIAANKPMVNREETITGENGTVSWISTTKVPLHNTQGELFGMLGIGRDITEQKRAEEQLARYTVELRRKNEQLEEDLRMAREIQQAFLPHQFPSFPHAVEASESALQFSHCYQPTDLVGGDFYYVLALSDTEAAVFICDVMGHGVRSALITAILRALVEELAPVAGDPSRFLYEINHALRAILKRTRTLMFATAFYLIADVARNEIRFANAGGHPSALHIQRDANTVSPLSSQGVPPGPALGLVEKAAYTTCFSQLALHDLFFFFTDGLYEVEGPDNEYYSQDRLLSEVDKRINVPPQRLFAELLEEIQNFSIKDNFLDDVCMVGMEVTRSGIKP